ncbi:unnamed protein product [Vitrella brassicaformis CCMP3155]|uniref:Histidine kinase/HSP90-like ATPase domain-containing protein n=2 Tax=Vitrella brassicaformis TaxID=1169539 RepID=A0A0G4FK69_VITBC|nr:unnamed protein product [Vitrella brassicaformis CCMP3155]|eukprot:CEM13956.1 unnamed protein product [Vitrella brassicaformis CCMP3155]
MEFRAETQKLLHIVTHSLYTDKEVFIRELISNASDALEKLRFLQVSGQAPSVPEEEGALRIVISADPAAKTFTIEDSGVGMTREDCIDNLGTIAKSGSRKFIEEANKAASGGESERAQALIGQFGVGFYSSFIVSDKVEVFTRHFDADKGASAWHWTSDGLGSFNIRECPLDEAPARGSRIVCHLKPDCLEFANPQNCKTKAEHFSSFISFPLYLKEGTDETRLNPQEALWLKSSVSEEEHKEFLRFLGNTTYGEPLYTLRFNTDAPLSIKSLFYIPEDAPVRIFQKQTDREVSVALHSRRVLVQKSASRVIPRWLGFIRGVIDCEDLPLNISRENMQDTRLMEKLSYAVVRRILKFFDEESQRDGKKFLQFYHKFSSYLKEGLLEDMGQQETSTGGTGGAHKNQLVKLLRYECSQKPPKEYISLEEYVKSMKAKQENIYYMCATNRQTALASPYMEQFLQKDRNVLLMYDEIDEFVAMNLQNYDGKKLVAVDSPEDDFEPLLEEEQEAEADEETKAEDKKDVERPALSSEQQSQLEGYIKGVLGNRVTAIKFSSRLTKSPAVVTGFLSSTMRKMMKSMMKGSEEGPSNLANLPVTLELNPGHELTTSLYHLQTSQPDIAQMLTEQLYDNACIAAGILDEPKTMLDRLNNLLQVTASYAYYSSSSPGVNQPPPTDAPEDRAATSDPPPPSEETPSSSSGRAASSESFDTMQEEPTGKTAEAKA